LSEQEEALRNESKPEPKKMGKFNSMNYFEPTELGEQNKNLLIYPERRVGSFNL
jgi:hypothetical protein